MLSCVVKVNEYLVQSVVNSLQDKDYAYTHFRLIVSTIVKYIPKEVTIINYKPKRILKSQVGIEYNTALIEQQECQRFE